MTQEEKQLLVKDLCARLPYSVTVECSIESGESVDLILNTSHIDELVDDSLIVKPYLRPMSSMTEEEKLKLEDMEFEIAHLKFTTYAHECMILDYLYSCHLDVRGLIPMGLAIKAPENMYKTK